MTFILGPETMINSAAVLLVWCPGNNYPSAKSPGRGCRFEAIRFNWLERQFLCLQYRKNWLGLSETLANLGLGPGVEVAKNEKENRSSHLRDATLALTCPELRSLGASK